MDEKRKRSDEPNLDLCLKPPSEVEIAPTKKILSLDEAMDFELKHGLPYDGDVKKLRRTVSNRLSAQRSRLRRVEYTAELEKSIKDLEETIASVGPKIETVKEKKEKLQAENEKLQEQLDRITDKANQGAARTEELRLELKRLRKLTMGYDDDAESVAEMDIDQYLNLDDINFNPLKTNWDIDHGLKDILEAHKDSFTDQGHKSLYEILTTSLSA